MHWILMFWRLIPMVPKKYHALLIVFALLLAACSGRLICEYQTEDEQFQELIKETIREVSKETE